MATTKVGIYYDPRKKHPWIVRWFGEYEPATGEQRRYSKGFRLKRDAEHFHAEKQASFDKGTLRDHRGQMTLGEFCRLYLERRGREWRATTQRNQKDIVSRLLGLFGAGTALRDIRPIDAQRFWMEAQPIKRELLGRELSRETRNRLLREAKTAFNYAVRWELIPANPFCHLKQQQIRKQDRRGWHYLTPAEYRLLLASAPTQAWKCFYALNYTAGLRYGEAVNLSRDNLDLGKQIVSVRSRPATDILPPFGVKDHEDRYVPIPKTTARMLAELLVTLKDDIYFILLTPNRNREIVAKWQEHRRLGKPWTNGRMANNMLVSFRRHAKWAGIADHKTITIHSLRKSCGVNWANNLPLHVTQAYMGHADIKTTQQYYLSVGEEHAERASWVIEQITMGSDDTTDARVTPAPENQANRKVG